jgi:hypothetical protein
MKKTLIAGLIFSALSSPAFAGEDKDFADIILDKAKSKLAGKIGSMLIDSIFGFSSGPNYATLSKESLQAIEDRVRKVVISAEEADALSDLESLDLSIGYFHATVEYGQPDISILDEVLLRSNDLVTHHAFKASFNDDYFLLASNYALVASLNVAIYTERHLQGYISDTTVKLRAKTLATTLNTMHNAARTYVNSNIVSRGCHFEDDNYEIVCQGQNKINGSWYGAAYDIGEQFDWSAEMDQYRTDFLQNLVGDLPVTVAKLNNM